MQRYARAADSRIVYQDIYPAEPASYLLSQRLDRHTIAYVALANLSLAAGFGNVPGRSLQRPTGSGAEHNPRPQYRQFACDGSPNPAPRAGYDRNLSSYIPVISQAAPPALDDHTSVPESILSCLFAHLI